MSGPSGSSDPGPWRRVDLEGPVGELHAASWPDPLGRTVWVMRPVRPALVLGSTQRHLADELAVPAADRGLEVVVRGSGGGAVLVDPGSMVWIDVFLSRTDPLWVDDVGRSSRWLGDVWADALGRSGVASEVASGPYDSSRWGSLVCFAGTAPGEVLAAGVGDGVAPKLVGISQKRTRLGSRLQSMLHLGSDAEVIAGVLGGVVGAEDRTGLRAAVEACTGVVRLPAHEVVDAFLASLSELTDRSR